MSEITQLLARDIYNIDERNKIVFSVFKIPTGQYYMRLAKHFFSTFDEGWIPTKEGISVPLNIYTSSCLFDSLVDILAIEEVKTYLKRAVNVDN